MSVNKERKHHSSNKNYKQITTMRLWKNMIKIEFNLENYEDVFIEGYLQNHEVTYTLILRDASQFEITCYGRNTESCK